MTDLQKNSQFIDRAIRFCSQSIGRRTSWLAYASTILIQILLFLYSLYLRGESEVLFSIVYFFSAVFAALFIGRGAGVLAGTLAAISVKFHYGTGEGFAFLLVVFLIIQLTVGILSLLQQSVENAEREKRRAEDAVRAREEILSIVAHDLRQPLTSISLRTSLIQDMLTDQSSPQAKKYLSENYCDVGRIDRMIGDLLDLAQIDSKQISVKKQVIDLIDLTHQVVGNYKKTHPQTPINVTSSTQLFVMADSDRFQQILGNLISNAIKYGTPGAEVRVDIDSFETMAEITVKNHGPGIPSHQIRGIFDRFMRTPEAKMSQTRGLGLGLYITKSLVEAQNGKIWVESTPGLTTNFHFQLPISKPAIDNKSLPISILDNHEKQDLNGTHVLLVDDSPDSLKLLQIYLQKAGARVTAADSASDAMTKLKLNPPDLIISDIEMPGDDGYALIKKILQFNENQNRRIPVVALTGHSSDQDVERMTAAGFDLHLSKPVAIDKLYSAVKTLMQSPQA